MANVILPNHVDDLPVVEPNQPDVVPVIPELVLVDEDEDLEEEEFKEEKEPQEEEDMADPLNPPPPAFELEPEDVIEVEDTVEPEDETVLASVYKSGRKLGNAEERAECKKLKKGLEEARPNEAIDVPVEDEKSPSSET
ncbi:hypothetical protein Tco_0749423 [Tanacetum coccineum]|uniref:Uncharacterized protein n=1 Tax=Tanacetum coccineum TaxID=301880 RepID=A0ABQ4Z155_9ASTR